MIVNRQRKVRVALRPLEEFARRVQKAMELRDADVTICFVSDDEIAGMNEKFREKSGPTDVLSFSAIDRSKGTKRKSGTRGKNAASAGKSKSAAVEKYLGDIAIAPETARRYAKKNGRRLTEELRVLILHGMLHLLGYDHETDHGEMNRVEQKMRRRFGLA